MLRTLLRPVYHGAFRSHLRTRFWLSDHFGSKPPSNPGSSIPPALLRYRVGESLSTESFLRIGESCANYIDQQAQAMGMSLNTVERVLDFGCGCGRTLRWLMERHPATQFYGSDVDADAIGWCSSNLCDGVFLNNKPEPPLAFATEFFDVVYCLSVFTHLDEQMQDLWLTELKRILKPGGIVILTVHGERAAASLDEGAAQSLKAAGFLHRQSRKLSGIVPKWYGTSWHSRSYITARLGRSFDDVRYTAVPDGVQDLVVARNVS